MKINQLLFLLLFTFSLNTFSFSQSSWEQIATYPDGGIERVFSFEIDGILYIGCGRRSFVPTTSNFWAYDVLNNVWIPKNNFPGASRRNAFSFQIGGFGYIGTGYDGNSYLNDVWRYNPENDTWTQLEDFPGGARSHSLAVSLGSRAFIFGGGRSEDNVIYSYANGLWEFDANSESWIMLEPMPGTSRWRAFGWIINQKIFIGGGGQFPEQGLVDFYSYDIPTGTWTVLNDLPTSKSIGGFYFTLQEKGYYVEGSSQVGGNTEEYGRKVFEYDPISDNWEEDLDFIGPERTLGFSLVMDSMAIVGLGRSYLNDDFYDDIYSFSIEPTTVNNAPLVENQFEIYPNPVSSGSINIRGQLLNEDGNVYSIYDMNGLLQFPPQYHLDFETLTIASINIEHLKKGMYLLEIKNKNQTSYYPFVKM